MAKYIGKRVSQILIELLSEQVPGTDLTRNKKMAQALLDIAFDEKQNAKTRLEAINAILDRTEGKAVQTNINADIEINPFEGIPTEQIEALKKQFELLKQ